MPIHISNKKVNDIHVGTKKVLTAWVGTDRVFLASTLSMLIKGYTEKSGDSLLSANTPLKFTGENIIGFDKYEGERLGITYSTEGDLITLSGTASSNFNLFIPLKHKIIKGTNFSSKIFGTGFINGQNISLAKSNGVYSDTELLLYGTADQFKRTTRFDYEYLLIQVYAGVEINSSIRIMMKLGNEYPTTFEPYHETFYNPTEGFSLNGVNNIYDTFNTINGELIKRFGVVDLGSLTYSEINTTGSSPLKRFQARLEGVKINTVTTAIPNIICAKYDAVSPSNTYNRIEGITITGEYVNIYDNEYNYQGASSALKNALNGVYFVYELATPQTYQKKPKTLPQWIKHVFDSSGKELEATITQ